MIISYKNNKKICTINSRDYLYVKKTIDKTFLFEYLNAKAFFNYLPPEEITDSYEIYLYNQDGLTTLEKLDDFLKTVGALHQKTLTYQEIDKKKMEEFYQDKLKEISALREYYLSLQDYFESSLFLSPSAYLLLLNISNIYKAINYSESTLKSWYTKKLSQDMERIVLLNNDLSLENFTNLDIPRLTSWNSANKGIVVFDFLKFYKKEYLNFDMDELFNKYQSYFKYTEEELLLFYSLVALPAKLEFKRKNNFLNTALTKELILYVEKTNEFLSKQYEKNKKTNEEELKK